MSPRRDPTARSWGGPGGTRPPRRLALVDLGHHLQQEQRRLAPARTAGGRVAAPGPTPVAVAVAGPGPVEPPVHRQVHEALAPHSVAGDPVVSACRAAAWRSSTAAAAPTEDRGEAQRRAAAMAATARPREAGVGVQSRSSGRRRRLSSPGGRHGRHGPTRLRPLHRRPPTPAAAGGRPPRTCVPEGAPGRGCGLPDRVGRQVSTARSRIPGQDLLEQPAASRAAAAGLGDDPRPRKRCRPAAPGRRQLAVRRSPPALSAAPPPPRSPRRPRRGQCRQTGLGARRRASRPRRRRRRERVVRHRGSARPCPPGRATSLIVSSSMSSRLMRMSPATTRPLSSTRSSTSARLADWGAGLMARDRYRGTAIRRPGSGCGSSGRCGRTR